MAWTRREDYDLSGTGTRTDEIIIVPGTSPYEWTTEYAPLGHTEGAPDIEIWTGTGKTGTQFTRVASTADLADNKFHCDFMRGGLLTFHSADAGLTLYATYTKVGSFFSHGILEYNMALPGCMHILDDAAGVSKFGVLNHGDGWVASVESALGATVLKGAVYESQTISAPTIPNGNIIYLLGYSAGWEAFRIKNSALTTLWKLDTAGNLTLKDAITESGTPSAGSAGTDWTRKLRDSSGVYGIYWRGFDGTWLGKLDSLGNLYLKGALTENGTPT